MLLDMSVSVDKRLTDERTVYSLLISWRCRLMKEHLLTSMEFVRVIYTCSVRSNFIKRIWKMEVFQFKSLIEGDLCASNYSIFLKCNFCMKHGDGNLMHFHSREYGEI